MTVLLTADQVTRIHATLEPVLIAHMAQDVCSEVLGPCELRLFGFVDADRKRLLRIGGEGELEVMEMPGLDGGGGVGATERQGAPGGVWRSLLPALPGEDALGIVEIHLPRAIDSSEIAGLEPIARALAGALRNAKTFENTKQQTFTDDLTALHNARFMKLYLDREVKRCRRTKASLSLLFMDLDGFKNVNDTHGHLAGSRTLVEVGRVLEKTVRDADVLIRYGGDEFVILFPETPLSGGLVIAERIRQAIEATRFLESLTIEARVSASIGLAAYPESADDVRGLISSADRAMYQAKALGKNRVVAASPLRSPESTQRP